MGEGFSLWSMISMAWEGRSPSEIGSVSLSLSVSAFSDSALSPFLIFPEIRDSDWIKTFTMIFFPEISLLAAKEEQQPPYGVPTMVRGTPAPLGRAPCLVSPSGIVSRLFFFPKKS